MKPILFDLEYENVDNRSYKLEQEDISPAYYQLLKKSPESDIQELVDSERGEYALLDTLGETFCDMPQYQDEQGLSANWMAYGADLIEDLSTSLERDYKPEPDDIKAVYSLVLDWIAEYEKSDIFKDNMQKLINKAANDARDIIASYKLSEPDMLPVLTELLAKLVLIDGFEKSLVDAISRNEGNDLMKAMQITQNIASKFQVSS